MIIGAASVGKTTLIHRYITGNFQDSISVSFNIDLVNEMFLYFTFPPVHLVYKKMKLGKKISRPPDWPFFCPPGLQETIVYLRVASGRNHSEKA